METKKKYTLHKCRCGRIKRYGEWIRPIGKDLKDIRDNWNNIEFIPEQCSHCRQAGPSGRQEGK